MPISLLEAMACEALPVCTPVGGIPEMVENYGVLSKSTNEMDFYDALVLSYSLLDTQKRTGALLKKFKKIYSIESCANSYMNLYEKLLIK